MNDNIIKKNKKIVFLGDSSVGKSSLSNRFVRGDFTEFQEPTIGAAYLTKDIVVDDKIIRLEMWDTAGQERYKSLAPMYYRGAQGALILYDVTCEDSFNGAKSWIKELKKHNPTCYLLLVGNKCDLDNYRKISNDEVEDFCSSNSIEHILVSAKSNINVEETFEKLGRNIINIDYKKPDKKFIFEESQNNNRFSWC